MKDLAGDGTLGTVLSVLGIIGVLLGIIVALGSPQLGTGLKRAGAIVAVGFGGVIVAGVVLLLVSTDQKKSATPSSTDPVSKGGAPLPTIPPTPGTNPSIPTPPPQCSILTEDETKEFITDYTITADKDDDASLERAWAMLGDKEKSDWGSATPSSQPTPQFVAWWVDEVEHVELGQMRKLAATDDQISMDVEETFVLHNGVRSPEHNTFVIGLDALCLRVLVDYQP